MHKLQALPSPFPDFQMIQGKTEHLGRVGQQLVLYAHGPLLLSGISPWVCSNRS